MCVIDEYAIIVRRCDWFIPTNPPIKAFSIAITIVISHTGPQNDPYEDVLNDEENEKLIIARGASFCQVDKIRADVHEMDVMTEGYQKWHGTIPSLRTRAINSNTGVNWLGVLEFDHRDILLISKILDPRAWARKYFTAASVSWDFFECIIIGINLSRLISKATHRNSQFVLEIAISVLKIIMEEDKIKNGEFIKTWRNRTT